jgi:NAD(P)-dependent dehydrogenase (short-subunit alcohol dehydrogenase family)
MQLKDKVALVTGASSGIGHAAAKAFAAAGAAVVVVARRQDKLDALVKDIQASGAKAIRYVGDVREESTAAGAVALAINTFGQLDVAFNNAGVLGPAGATTEIHLDDWNGALQSNLTSAFLGAKHQAAAMLKAGRGGSIIFTSTFVGHTVGFPGVAAYAASKAGLIGLTQALAAEWGPKGIRVNALLPGAVDTDMYRAMNATPESQQFIQGLHALKRVATAQELAQTALYLASDAASFTTGHAMLVDGGLSINRT